MTKLPTLVRPLCITLKTWNGERPSPIARRKSELNLRITAFSFGRCVSFILLGSHRSTRAVAMTNFTVDPSLWSRVEFFAETHGTSKPRCRPVVHGRRVALSVTIAPRQIAARSRSCGIQESMERYTGTCTRYSPFSQEGKTCSGRLCCNPRRSCIFTSPGTSSRRCATGCISPSCATSVYLPPTVVWSDIYIYTLERGSTVEIQSSSAHRRCMVLSECRSRDSHGVVLIALVDACWKTGGIGFVPALLMGATLGMCIGPSGLGVSWVSVSCES